MSSPAGKSSDRGGRLEESLEQDLQCELDVARLAEAAKGLVVVLVEQVADRQAQSSCGVACQPAMRPTVAMPPWRSRLPLEVRQILLCACTEAPARQPCSAPEKR